MRLWLTVVVYNCFRCGYDHTIKYKRIKDIKRTVDMPCPNPACLSHGDVD